MPDSVTSAHAAPPVDEVERIVEAWGRERPDLDLGPLEVLSRVGRLARHLDIARTTAFGAQDLQPWEFDVLACLRRAGPPFTLSAGRLMRETLVSSGTMTNRIDRLAQRGLVERLRDPQDRRSVLVALTDEGRARADGAITDLLDRERPLLQSLTAEQQELLADLLRRLLTPLDDERRGPPRSTPRRD
jgi:DNA-binding MarR family transcriptional regulator